MIIPAYAECPPACDYSDAEVYNTLDYSDPGIYTNADFYANLPDASYDKLDYNQVNYNQISNHSKIRTTKYLDDLGSSGSSISISGEGLQFTRNGLSHPNGSSIQIRGNDYLKIKADSETIYLIVDSNFDNELPAGKYDIQLDRGGIITSEDYTIQATPERPSTIHHNTDNSLVLNKDGMITFNEIILLAIETDITIGPNKGEGNANAYGDNYYAYETGKDILHGSGFMLVTPDMKAYAPTNPPGDASETIISKRFFDDDVVLREGDESHDVMKLQAFLEGYGYYGKAGIEKKYNTDSKFGGDTIKALKKYQEENGLLVDGVMGRGTRAMINSHTGEYIQSDNCMVLDLGREEGSIRLIDIANSQMTRTKTELPRSAIESSSGLIISDSHNSYEVVLNLPIPEKSYRPPNEYIIQRGDTLYDITREELGSGATITEITNKVKEIQSANPGIDPVRLQPGDTIIIPRETPPPKETPKREIWYEDKAVYYASTEIDKNPKTFNYAGFIERLEPFEGRVNTPNPVGSQGELDIGIGHTLQSQYKDTTESRQIFSRLFSNQVNFDAMMKGEQKLTDQQINTLAAYDVERHLARVRRRVNNFDNLNEELQFALLDAEYRGGANDLGPNTVKLINQGKYEEASKEYLNHRGYASAEKNNMKGIVVRMNANSEAMKNAQYN